MNEEMNDQVLEDNNSNTNDQLEDNKSEKDSSKENNEASENIKASEEKEKIEADLLEKFNSMMQEQLKTLRSEFAEIQEENKTLKEKTFEQEIETLLRNDELLNEDFLEFVKAENLEVVKNKMSKLNRILKPYVNEAVKDRLNNTYVPKINQDLDGVISKIALKQNLHINNLR